MRKLSIALIVVALVLALIGGITRLGMEAWITPARVWAGTAAILLLTAIGLNTLPKE